MNEPTDDSLRNADKMPISQEYLNALVDGELTSDERELAYRRIETDPEFKARVCETRTLKEMVKGLYGELPPAPSKTGASVWSAWWPQSMAAALMLAMGLGGGWLARGRVDAPPDYVRLAGLPADYQPVALSNHADPGKILLHLDSNDPARLEAVLDLAEQLLSRGDSIRRVEVLVNNYGLNLLRQDTSPYRARIKRLVEKNADLSFVACAQTVARYQREGVNVVLVPEAKLAPTAIGEVLGRMRDGWFYVKV